MIRYAQPRSVTNRYRIDPRLPELRGDLGGDVFIGEEPYIIWCRGRHASISPRLAAVRQAVAPYSKALRTPHLLLLVGDNLREFLRRLSFARPSFQYARPTGGCREKLQRHQGLNPSPLRALGPLHTYPLWALLPYRPCPD